MARKKTTQKENKIEDTLDVGQDAALFGTAVVGQKGQIVIPVSARRKLRIKTGDKIFVFGKGDQLLALIKADRILDFVSEFTKRLNVVRDTLISDLEKLGKKSK